MRDYSFNSTHMSCNPIEFCTDFPQRFRINPFAYFSSLPRRSNISIINTLERIRKSYSFSENYLKRDITLTNNFLRKESKLPISLELFFSCTVYLLKKLRLIVTGSCNFSRHRRFMREKFFKIEARENISQKFHDQ